MRPSERVSPVGGRAFSPNRRNDDAMRIDRGGALAIAALVASSWTVVGGCVGDDPSVAREGTLDGGGGDGPATLTCAPPQNSCGGKCVEGNDLTSCGTSCTACTAPANGLVSCDGTCKTSCNVGFSACGKECRDLKTDANNCGRCGRICGTACNDGQCAPTKVVDNLTDPLELAVGVANVFVRTGSSALVQASKAGGSSSSNVFDASAWEIKAGPSIDDINLYFLGTDPSAQTRVFKRGISSVLGSTAVAPVATCGLGCGLAVLGDTYAWFDAYDLHTCKGACTTVYDQPTGGQLQSLALTTTYAVWTNATGNGSIFRCTLPECLMSTRMTLFESGANTPSLIRVHKDIVYWLDNYTAGVDKARVLSCPIAGCGGVPKVIAKGENEMKGLAVDDSGVYFTVEGDTANLAGVVKVCRDLGAGCGVGSEILADKQAQSGAIVLDATHAYWLNRGVSGGSVT